MSNPAFEDMFNMVCGEKIGSGAHRDVFHHKWDESLVVKVELENPYRSFSNVRECLVWDNACDAVRKWLAPIDSMSPDGFILFQKKCNPIPYDYVFPEKIPSFMNDVKKSNFGLYKGQLVCVDYEIINITFPMGMKKLHI